MCVACECRQTELIHTHVASEVMLKMVVCVVRAEGSSKIQARLEQQSVRANPLTSQFRTPVKPGGGAKSSPSKDNPSPEPQLDDIKRGLTS